MNISSFMIMLLLAYGPLDWSFPWWVWALASLPHLIVGIDASTTPRKK